MKCLAILASALLISTTQPVAADSTAALPESKVVRESPREGAERDWGVNFTPFLWVARLDGHFGGDSGFDPIGTGGLDVPSKLAGMAMVDLSLRYRRFGVFADVVWLKIKASGNTGPPLDVNAALELGGAFGSGAAFYRFRPTPKLTIDPYIGARWWRIDSMLRLDDGISPPISNSAVIVWADPIFGARLDYTPAEKWFVRAFADIGGGVSKVQWQVYGGGGYDFARWFGLNVGYRMTGVVYEKNGFDLNAIIHGLVFGFEFKY